MKKILLISAAALCAAMMWSCSKKDDIKISGFDVSSVYYDPEEIAWSGNNAATITTERKNECEKAISIIFEDITKNMVGKHYSLQAGIKEQFEDYMAQLQAELDKLGFIGAKSGQSICTPHIYLYVTTTATGTDSTMFFSNIYRKEYMSSFEGITSGDITELQAAIDTVINTQFPLNLDDENEFLDVINKTCANFDNGKIIGDYVLFPTISNDFDTEVMEPVLAYKFGN